MAHVGLSGVTAPRRFLKAVATAETQDGNDAQTRESR
jgi:hypothetical protein